MEEIPDVTIALILKCFTKFTGFGCFRNVCKRWSYIYDMLLEQCSFCPAIVTLTPDNQLLVLTLNGYQLFKERRRHTTSSEEFIRGLTLSRTFTVFSIDNTTRRFRCYKPNRKAGCGFDYYGAIEYSEEIHKCTSIHVLHNGMFLITGYTIDHRGLVGILNQMGQVVRKTLLDSRLIPLSSGYNMKSLNTIEFYVSVDYCRTPIPQQVSTPLLNTAVNLENISRVLAGFAANTPYEERMNVMRNSLLSMRNRGELWRYELELKDGEVGFMLSYPHPTKIVLGLNRPYGVVCNGDEVYCTTFVKPSEERVVIQYNESNGLKFDVAHKPIQGKGVDPWDIVLIPNHKQIDQVYSTSKNRLHCLY